MTVPYRKAVDAYRKKNRNDRFKLITVICLEQSRAEIARLKHKIINMEKSGKYYKNKT